MTVGVDFSMRVLIALRAGDVAPFELCERFGANYSQALTVLRRKGFVVDLPSGLVSMTALGRSHCPTRRQKKVVS